MNAFKHGFVILVYEMKQLSVLSRFDKMLLVSTLKTMKITHWSNVYCHLLA